MRSRLPFFAFLASLSVGARADIGWTVDFDDPGGTYSAYYDNIRSNMLAAGNIWGSYLAGSGTIDIQVGFADIATANGASVTTGFSHMNGSTSVYNQGAAAEILTGVDPNGSGYDIRINIGSTYQSYLGSSYLDNLWFDPHPMQRTDTLPDGRTDAMSTFLHEIGHGLAFNGWRNGTTGNLPGSYESTFDENVVVGSGGYLYFDGPNASAAYGGPVPLTRGNYGHYGNASPGPGSDLVGYSLMNGVSYYYGARWGISAVDLGFMKDVGFTVVPEPASIAALGVGVCALLRRRRK